MIKSWARYVFTVLILFSFSMPISAQQASFLPRGPNLPITCGPGSVFIKSDATTGQQFYVCEGLNNWVAQTPGAGLAFTGATSITRSLSSQTTENTDLTSTLTTDSTYLTGTDITYSGGRGSSNVKLTGTWSGASGGYSNIYSSITSSGNLAAAGDGVIGIKGVVTNTGALTDGNIYGAQFIAKHNHATNKMANEAPLVGVEAWAYDSAAAPAGTMLGGNIGYHNEGTTAKDAGAVYRGLQIFCDDAAGSAAPSEATGLAIWNQAGTQNNAIKIVKSDGGFTYDLLLQNGETIDNATNGTIAIGATNVALGAANLTMTGSLAATGNRVTKGWFTDLEVTNLPTVNGNSIALTTEVDGSTALALTAAQVSNTTIYNTGQGPNNIDHTLPATVAGYRFTGAIGEAQGASYWRFTAASAGTLCLDGTCGKNYVQIAVPTQGAEVTCRTVKFASTGINGSAALATVAASPNVASGAFTFDISGTGYSKAAVGGGTAPGNDVVPQNKYGAVAFDIGADGTIDAIEASDNATGYDSAALAAAGLPAVGASHVRMGYVTAMKSDGAFTFGTTNLDAANVTVAYTQATAYSKAYNWICKTITGTWATN